MPDGSTTTGDPNNYYIIGDPQLRGDRVPGIRARAGIARGPRRGGSRGADSSPVDSLIEPPRSTRQPGALNSAYNSLMGARSIRIPVALLLCVSAAACDAGAGGRVGARGVAGSTPGFAVVELFTSEGCVNCPPAERVPRGTGDGRAGEPRPDLPPWRFTSITSTGSAGWTSSATRPGRAASRPMPRRWRSPARRRSSSTHPPDARERRGAVPRLRPG